MRDGESVLEGVCRPGMSIPALTILLYATDAFLWLTDKSLKKYSDLQKKKKNKGRLP